MTNTHKYFTEAAVVWERYFAGAIGWSKREVELASLRAKYFK
jgi:hypothetical protein